MADPFASLARTAVDPVTRHRLLTSGATPLDPRPRAIYCASAGTIEIEDEDGVALPYVLQAGDRIDFRGVRVVSIAGGAFYGWS